MSEGTDFDALGFMVTVNQVQADALQKRLDDLIARRPPEGKRHRKAQQAWEAERLALKADLENAAKHLPPVKPID